MIPNRSRWIVSTPLLEPRRLRLFCFPYAGGGASIYRTWARHLGPHGVEVCSVQLPGRENRLSEPRVDSLPALASTLATVLMDWLEEPFGFFGHSMGALLSFELVWELRRRGGPMPRNLFLSGARPPHLERVEPQLHQLPDDEFIDALGKRFGGIPREVLAEQELLELLLPSLRADITAFETYRYAEEAPIAVPITAIGGAQDFCVDPSHLEAWRGYTSREFAVRVFAGDHFFLNRSTTDITNSIAQTLRF